MAVDHSTALKDARERRGLSQQELAAAAGVSRSQVSAIEHGRHVPAVDAALRLAAAVGQSVEALFAAPERQGAVAVAVDGRPLPDGTRVRAARVGDRVVVAPAGPGPDGWAAAEGVIRHGRLELLAEGDADGCLVLGCDPALAVAGALGAAARRGPGRLIGVAASTGEALRALTDGRCHAALVHGPAGRLPTPPVPVARWHFARWEVGLGFAAGLGEPSLEALLAGRRPLVRRAASAASDQALVRAARRAGLRAPARDTVAAGHLEAAQRAAWTGGAAVTYRPAAAAHRLGFTPLETHVVELWVAETWRAHPGVTALLEALASPAFRDRVAGQDGYDLTRTGDRCAA
jgi:DNA-binding XRE family transcriptional regulator